MKINPYNPDLSLIKKKLKNSLVNPFQKIVINKNFKDI